MYAVCQHIVFTFAIRRHGGETAEEPDVAEEPGDPAEPGDSHLVPYELNQSSLGKDLFVILIVILIVILSGAGDYDYD
jgi:hypothetical protein